MTRFSYVALFIVLVISYDAVFAEAANTVKVCSATNSSDCLSLSPDQVKNNAQLVSPCRVSDPSCTAAQQVIITCTGEGSTQQCTFTKKDFAPATKVRDVCKLFGRGGQSLPCLPGKSSYKCGIGMLTIPFDYAVVYAPDISNQNPRLPSTTRLPDERVASNLLCKGDKVVVVLQKDKVSIPGVTKECSKEVLRKSGVLFLKTPEGKWNITCENRENLNPTDAIKAKNADEFNQNLKDNPGKPQRLDTEHGAVVAQCDKDGKCQMQVFRKDEKGNLIPGKLLSDGINPDSIKAVTQSLSGPDGKKNFDALFNASACSGPSCASESCTGMNCTKKSVGANDNASANKTPFKPTNASGQKKPQAGNQKPNTGNSQPQIPVAQSPAPYCANITVNKPEITVGESAVIQWNIPYAIRFEIRGGTATINGNSAVVKPKESTAYSVIGYGVPSASVNGQINSSYGSQFGANGQTNLYASQYSFGQVPQFGMPGQQNTCGIKDAACCGPITIVVNQKIQETKDVIADAAEENVGADFSAEKPEFTCAPNLVEKGKSAVALWSCPDGSVRSTTIAQHVDGTLLKNAESFYGEGKVAGSKKMYPEKDTRYTVRCLNEKGKKSESATCIVRTKDAQTTIKNNMQVKDVIQNASALQMDISANVRQIRARTDEVTITWRSTNAEKCTLSGPNGYSQENTKSGSVSGTSEVAGTITFHFACSYNGVQKKKSVSVEVID